MEVCDQLLLPETPETENAGAISNDGVEAADQLISDLAALIEAGLVVVQDHVLGPPRYGIGIEPAASGRGG
jgi:hypothetical protein